MCYRYEGTGRSLSLKLIHQLRQQSATYGSSSEFKKAISMATKTGDQTMASSGGRILHEIVLNESIRYASEDSVENWLNNILCLNCMDMQRVSFGCPLPETCDLYYVNRDTLFSYHKASEAFLHSIMSLYVSSHYKVRKTGHILNKSENATLLFLIKMAKKRFSFQFLFCKIKMS